MKKQKLALEELKVKSFVTKIDDNEAAVGGSLPLVVSIIIVVSVTGCFPEEVNKTADTCGLSVAPAPAPLPNPGIPIQNNTLVPGPCNTQNVCIA